MRLFLFTALLSLSTFISGFAQTSLEIDTFRISAKSFIVEAPADWFSIKVVNELQPDTSWNYIAKYISTGTNTVAQIAIQIVNNSNYTPTKKEEKKFKKECTVATTTISGFSGYSLKYTPKKPKNCNSCDRVYQDMYSIPLNMCQTLQVVFVGQGPKKNIYPLQITFNQFVQRFISLNSSSLKTFLIVDFSQPMLRDTFQVNNYFLTSLLPYHFSHLGLTRNGKYEIQRNDICSRSFTIRVTSRVVTQTTNKTRQDTNVSISRSNYLLDNQPEPKLKFQTTRTIPTHDGNMIVLTITCFLRYDELNLQSYVVQMLNEYSNALVAANPIAKTFAPRIFNTPNIDPKPKNDNSQPVKFDKKMPVARPK